MNCSLLAFRGMLLAGLAILSIPGPLMAQSNAIDAALEGYVHDESGGAVLGAKITVRNVETNINSDTVSAGNGYYRLPILKVGTYNVSVAATGSKSTRRPV